MATQERPGRLPGRQTEVPNAGDDFPAEHDLKRAKHQPQGVRQQVQETDIEEDARGLRDTGDLGGPEGASQESRGRGSRQQE
ncbi:MAG TPA: hypothetical protein VM899_06560 [Rubellimicrobium sp.]|jgi:hypothetical protein|nr:hypothetical protein [Rubellimicrobium sp.]